MEAKRIREIARELTAVSTDWPMLERAITLAVTEALEEAGDLAGQWQKADAIGFIRKILTPQELKIAQDVASGIETAIRSLKPEGE